MGALVAAHPRYHLIPLEVRIHAAGSGLPDLLAGRVGMERFVDRVLGKWWERGANNRRGLKVLVERPELEAAVDEFRAAFARDSLGASRELVSRLLDPVAERAGKPYWVEVSGRNIASSPAILRIFPDARFIHMFRDGRSVAASILNREDMTADPLLALRHWTRRVRSADAALRVMSEDKVLSVRLEDLVKDDRERSLRRLVEFLEIEDDGPLREHFDAQVSPEAAHVGKWRERIDEKDARRLEHAYAEAVGDLRRDGISWVPAPEEAASPPSGRP